MSVTYTPEGQVCDDRFTYTIGDGTSGNSALGIIVVHHNLPRDGGSLQKISVCRWLRRLCLPAAGHPVMRYERSAHAVWGGSRLLDEFHGSPMTPIQNARCASSLRTLIVSCVGLLACGCATTAQREMPQRLGGRGHDIAFAVAAAPDGGARIAAQLAGPLLGDAILVGKMKKGKRRNQENWENCAVCRERERRRGQPRS